MGDIDAEVVLGIWLCTEKERGGYSRHMYAKDDCERGQERRGEVGARMLAHVAAYFMLLRSLTYCNFGICIDKELS